MKTKIMKNLKALSALLPLAAMSAHGVLPGTVSLDFALSDNDPKLGGIEQILNYYNGGADGNGAIGPSYGITFGSDEWAALNYDQGGISVGNEPGGGNAMFCMNGVGDVVDVAGGFTSGFSFYEASSATGSVQIYSGLDGTGTLLASFNLADTGVSTVEPYFDIWTNQGVAFSGVAKSAVFSCSAQEFAFTDMTLGSKTPIMPQDDPSAPDTTGMSIYAIAAFGLAGAARTMRKPALVKI
jgi:hypothetical protein